MKRTRRMGWVGGALVMAVLMVGCALYRNDRAWLPDDQYTLARTMYIQTGSLDLVQRQLENLQWRRARINEAIYRLQKEFEVLPEEVPAAEIQATVTTATTPMKTMVITPTTATTTTPALKLPPPPAPAK